MIGRGPRRSRLHGLGALATPWWCETLPQHSVTSPAVAGRCAPQLLSSRNTLRGLGAGNPNALGPTTPSWCNSPYLSAASSGLLSWLTLGLESGPSAAQINATCYPTTIQSPVAEIPPQTPQQMTGAAEWTPDMAIQGTNALQQQQNQGFFMNFGTGTPTDASGAGSNPPPTGNSLCQMIFGNTIAGQIGQTLCPLVMIVGGVAAIALISFIFIEKH